MEGGIFIERNDFMQLMKKINYLEEYVKNSLREKQKSKWVSQEEAMEMLGCGKTKLNELRRGFDLDWRTNGKGRGVQISRASIEKFIDANSTIIKKRQR